MFLDVGVQLKGPFFIFTLKPATTLFTAVRLKLLDKILPMSILRTHVCTVWVQWNECKQQVLSQRTVAMLTVPRSQAVMSLTGSKLWQLTAMFS